MKSLCITILFLISCFSIKAQQDTIFNKLLKPFHGTTLISSLIETDSFYYALISQKDIPDFIQNYSIIKVSKQGVIIDSNIWKHTDTSVAFNFGHEFILSSDGYFLISGSTVNSGGTIRGILAKVHRQTLDTVWTRWINHPDTLIASQADPDDIYTTLTDVKECPDGCYIIVGNYNKNCINGNIHGFISKTDTLGNIIWFKGMPSSIISSNHLYDIEIDPIDSGFYFPSNRSNIQPLNYSLFKSDKEGDILWHIAYNNTQNPKLPSGPEDATVINDSTVIIASAYWHNSSSGNRSVIVTSVNTKQISINWEKEYSFYNYLKGPTLHQTIGANLTPSGRIAISSTVFTSVTENAGSYRGTILLINQNGDSLWQRHYAHTYNDTDNIDLQLNDLIVCDDGGFLFGGFYNDHYDMYSHCWLVKTDSMGYAPASFTVGIEENEMIIRNLILNVYPNPTTDAFSLQIEKAPSQPILLRIFDMQGKLFKEERLPPHQNVYRVNIEGLGRGNYIVHITDGEQTAIEKFTVIK